MSGEWKPKPWLAILLGIFTQCFTFLYLNKARLFLFYLIAVMLVGLLDWRMGTYVSLVFFFICPLHAFFLSKYEISDIDRKWYSRWWGISAAYLLYFVTIFGFRSFLYEPYEIPAQSMSPTLNVGDNIIVKKVGFGSYGTYGLNFLSYDISKKIELEIGKVYVFYPPHKDVAFVKRLVGVPGDTIQIYGAQILVNGEKIRREFLSENAGVSLYKEYINNNTYEIQQLVTRPYLRDITTIVPEDHYFFLGDNRDNSSDSRIWGPVPSSRFIGEVVYVSKN